MRRLEGTFFIDLHGVKPDVPVVLMRVVVVVNGRAPPAEGGRGREGVLGQERIRRMNMMLVVLRSHADGNLLMDEGGSRRCQSRARGVDDLDLELMRPDAFGRRFVPGLEETGTEEKSVRDERAFRQERDIKGATERGAWADLSSQAAHRHELHLQVTEPEYAMVSASPIPCSADEGFERQSSILGPEPSTSGENRQG